MKDETHDDVTDSPYTITEEREASCTRLIEIIDGEHYFSREALWKIGRAHV